jgi:nucleotide-binding universal stress UspA family protein
MRDQGPILVPLDGSDLSEGALPYASAIAKGLNARIVLLTTWEGTENEFGSTFPSMAVEDEQKAQEHFTGYLDGVKSRLGGAQVETVLRSGEAVDEILRIADEKGARMIVMSTRGRSGIGRWVYGSVAGHVLRNASVPVLAVGPKVLEQKQASAEFRHLMVPLDGSQLSEAALAPAQQLAAKLSAKLSLVRVVNWAVQSYPYTLPDAYVPQVDQELEAGAREYLRRKESEVGPSNVSAFVIRGAVADGLMEFEEKEGVDLAVMTTHARSGLARVALGSVADRMLQGSAPVLLVRPE